MNTFAVLLALAALVAVSAGGVVGGLGAYSGGLIGGLGGYSGGVIRGLGGLGVYSGGVIGGLGAPVAAYGPATAAIAAPVAAVAPSAAIDYYAYPRYSFGYGVSDALTGDSKSQVETRDGPVTKGQYSVAEPDGTIRVVNYAADSINGFNAVVSKIGASAHPAPAVAGLGYAAPIAAKVWG